MDNLELKRKRLELSRVSVAKEEQEFKIAEYQDQIKRLESMVEIQKAKEEQLKEEIKQLENK